MKFKFIDNQTKKISKEYYPNVTSIIDDCEDYEDGNYPDFYDFKNGVHISNEEKQIWVNQIMDTFNKRPEETHCSISCGRSKVIGLKHCDEIEILVIDNYMSATVFLDE